MGNLQSRRRRRWHQPGGRSGQKVRGGVDQEAGAPLLRHVHGEEQAGLGERRGGEGEQSKAKEEAQQQHQEQRQEGGEGEEDNQTKEHGEQKGADPNRGLEQPSLEDRATSTQSSSCQGVLVICLPLNMPKNIISALYVIYNAINYL